MNQKFQKGDVIVFKAEENDWLSKAIGYLTDSDASHAAMVYSDDSIVEVGARGIEVNKTAVSEGDTVYVMRLDSEPDSTPLIQSADAYLASGVGYDFAGLFILGGLLIYRKVVPTSKLLTISNRILYAACLGLDKVINQVLLHHTDKVMVCSQLVYQIFYDCGGEYRIHIEDGNLINDTQPDTSPYSIRLADYIDTESAQPKTAAPRKNPKGIQTSQEQDELIKSLCLALSEADENEDLRLIKNNVDQLPDEVLDTINLASDFLSKLKRLLAELDSDMSPASLFITPADLVYHAVNLKEIGTLYLERIPG